MSRSKHATDGIGCPKCGEFVGRVSRVIRHDGIIRRKRRCSCGSVFETVERLTTADPYQAAIDSRQLALAINILIAHKESLCDASSVNGKTSGQ